MRWICDRCGELCEGGMCMKCGEQQPLKMFNDPVVHTRSGRTMASVYSERPEGDSRPFVIATVLVFASLIAFLAHSSLLLEVFLGAAAAIQIGVIAIQKFQLAQGRRKSRKRHP